MAYALAADDVAIHYEVHGRGDRFLVLLAGQSNNHHWWDSVRADFDVAFRTVTFDYRGTGRSDKPDVEYSTRGFADDVIAILDHLGVERAHVYGTSMGGRVAQWVAAEHLSRVDRLVLGCTSPGGEHAIERSKEVHRALARRDPTQHVLKELMYTSAWLAANPGPHGTLGDPDMPPYAKRRHFAASAGHDAWAVLPRIAAPTLVVHGGDDVFNPTANAPLLAARIPDTRLRIVDGARHAYFEEFRAVASPLVLDFLRESAL